MLHKEKRVSKQEEHRSRGNNNLSIQTEGRQCGW
jgi:hypothetical protein